MSWLPASLNQRSERLNFAALAGSVSLVLLSIAVSQILLACAIVGVVAAWGHLSPRPRWQPIMWPLLLFTIWTTVAALSGPRVPVELTILKKFFLFAVLLLVPIIFRGAGRSEWTYKAIFASSVISSVVGIIQFADHPDRDLLHRISGFMSQWMTYSGLLMLALVALAAYIVSYGWRQHKWVIPTGLILLSSIYLSQTRNAWLGTLTGVIVVLLLRRPRAIALLFLFAGAIYLLSPVRIQQRLQSGFDLTDPNTKNRIELFETSMRLIRDHPWVGVGPRNVGVAALNYRGTQEFPNWMYQHMHNNFLQIAAERGLPGLFFWLWFMTRLAWDAFRVYRANRGSGSYESGPLQTQGLMVSIAALGAWSALLTSGLFEYNFGDSEVLTLFLFMMGAPYAVDSAAARRTTTETTKALAADSRG